MDYKILMQGKEVNVLDFLILQVQLQLWIQLLSMLYPNYSVWRIVHSTELSSDSFDSGDELEPFDMVSVVL